jgi:hypothetical protein
MEQALDITAGFPPMDGEREGFEFQFGFRPGGLMMWVSSEGGQSGGCRVDRKRVTMLRDFLDRLLVEWPPLQEVE